MIRFVEFGELYLNKSLEWLNDDVICRLVNTGKPTKESQWQWYERIKCADDYLIWGIECDGIPVGVCGIKHVTKESGEYWGYIGEKSYWGNGIGKTMIEFILLQANKMGLSTIYLHVLEDNFRAINLYEREGFKFQEFAKGGLIYELNLKNKEK